MSIINPAFREPTLIKPFCGEIHYQNSEGGVHSDICFCCGFDTDKEQELTDERRKFYHELLDEWFDSADGTGMFWVGDPNVWTMAQLEYKEKFLAYELAMVKKAIKGNRA